uniref:Uncharacterized protein n=1 Tax=Timema douglasi TaxID=61478 RepID=A0A7R8Z6K2_TIMDO|nr:unnamed protein product [Timema douglasi]
MNRRADAILAFGDRALRLYAVVCSVALTPQQCSGSRSSLQAVILCLHGLHRAMLSRRFFRADAVQTSMRLHDFIQVGRMMAATERSFIHKNVVTRVVSTVSPQDGSSFGRSFFLLRCLSEGEGEVQYLERLCTGRRLPSPIRPVLAMKSPHVVEDQGIVVTRSQSLLRCLHSFGTTVHSKMRPDLSMRAVGFPSGRRGVVSRPAASPAQACRETCCQYFADTHFQGHRRKRPFHC